MKRTLTTALLAGTTLLAAPAAVANDFCSNAFYPGDQNADGAMSPEEVTALRGAEFQALDMNDDGSINRHEYANCMQQAGTRRMAQTDGALFDAADTDGDGSITIPEYFDSAVEAYGSAVGEGAGATGWDQPFIWTKSGEDDMDMPDTEEFTARVADTIHAADADLDGTLTRDEWLNRAEDYEVDITQVNQMFDAIDADGSGDISADEYQAAGEEAAANAVERAREDGMQGDFPPGHPPVQYFRYEVDGFS